MLHSFCRHGPGLLRSSISFPFRHGHTFRKNALDMAFDFNMADGCSALFVQAMQDSCSCTALVEHECVCMCVKTWPRCFWSEVIAASYSCKSASYTKSPHAVFRKFDLYAQRFIPEHSYGSPELDGRGQLEFDLDLQRWTFLARVALGSQ